MTTSLMMQIPTRQQLRAFAGSRMVAAGVVLVGIVAVVFVLEQPRQAAACEGSDGGLHAIQLADREENCRTLAEFQAPITVVNVWASWCPFCVEELPDFGEISAEFPSVPIVAINRGESRERAEAFLRDLEIAGDITFLFDSDDSFYRRINGVSMPETVFLDENGAVLLHKRGALTRDDMRETL